MRWLVLLLVGCGAAPKAHEYTLCKGTLDGGQWVCETKCTIACYAIDDVPHLVSADFANCICGHWMGPPP